MNNRDKKIEKGRMTSAVGFSPLAKMSFLYEQCPMFCFLPVANGRPQSAFNLIQTS